MSGNSMLKLSLGSQNQPLRLLCIGAHSDDLEIGCGGTVLQWLDTFKQVEVAWVVFSAPGQREAEARVSANALLKNAKRVNLVLRNFRDGHFPAHFSEIKELFEEIKASESPDIILTPRLEDRHQDHRLIAEITWQTFRNHLILEYEIPKYEGDLGQPNFFVLLSSKVCKRKLKHLMKHFGSQRAKAWFTEDTFTSILRLRGLESNAAEKFAEAFYCRKLVI
ncbi:MAG TPA: PIG-L deacetylase family protein [Terriglobales bacterium]|nr:PIG-L deacetylase family protein [Terriglobales bacterium]